LKRDTFVRLTALAALLSILLVAYLGYERLAVALYIAVGAAGTVYALAEDYGSAWIQMRRYRAGLGDGPSTRRGGW